MDAIITAIAIAIRFIGRCSPQIPSRGVKSATMAFA
jgi:hypothetical protein